VNPAPTLLNEWITPTGFGVIVAILLVLAVIVVVAENLRERLGLGEDDEDDTPYDDRLARQVARYHCAGHGCYMVVASVVDEGTTWRCANCRRESWVPCADVPYDQQSDVSEWEREVGA